MNNKGFTLIEIMITAAIIALLAVTAYPSLGKLQERQNVDSDLSIIESCFLTAVATAKAPSEAGVDKVILEYRTASDSCIITESKTSGDKEVASYVLAGKNDYSMHYPNQVSDKDKQAVIQIQATAPYVKTYVNGSNNLKIELKNGTKLMGETTINTEFGTIL